MAIAPWLACLGCAYPQWMVAPALAQALRPAVRDPFLADPLSDVPRDPLLPSPPIPRPLSPLELYSLAADLDQLALEAVALAQAGETDQAREVWMREVRLRRLLGIDVELAALDRVAQNIRNRNPTRDLQLLSARLGVIQPSLAITDPTDRDRLETIATLYTTLGNVEAATALRQELAGFALAQGDGAAYQSQLEKIAQLYADWLDFDQAAATYAELVQLAQAQGNQGEEIQFLQGQIENLQAAQRFEEAVVSQQQLLSRYNTDETLWPRVAELQNRMAANYRTLGQLETASRQYQAAYTNAIASGQLNLAAEAIRGLASLLRSLERWPDVDYLYQQLVLVEREAINAYGLMDTFDQLGQLYEQLNQPESALQAYREGLILARQLNHRQAYFETQIRRLSS